MDKVKLNKVERDEVIALNEARQAYNKACEDIEAKKQALNEAKNATTKNKASLIGNAYIAYCEAQEAFENAFIAYTKAEENVKNTEKSFPKCDSKEDWKKAGFEEEYKAISTWYTCADSILECMQTLRSIQTVNKQDILNYFSCYRHQITNCNDMVKFGTISKDSVNVVRNASNYAFKDKFARASNEAEKARQDTIERFNEVLNLLLDSFIE